MRLFVILDKPVPEASHQRTRRPARAAGLAASSVDLFTSSKYTVNVSG
jgi:hypothetical protein